MRGVVRCCFSGISWLDFSCDGEEMGTVRSLALRYVLLRLRVTFLLAAGIWCCFNSFVNRDKLSLCAMISILVPLLPSFYLRRSLFLSSFGFKIDVTPVYCSILCFSRYESSFSGILLSSLIRCSRMPSSGMKDCAISSSYFTALTWCWGMLIAVGLLVAYTVTVLDWFCLF